MKKTFVAIAALAILLVGTPSGAYPSTPYSRAAMRPDGTEGNGGSSGSSMSSDGRYVTFFSLASNLVPGDTNGASDVYLKDRLTGTVERVSVSADGTQANGPSRTTTSNSISGDGRWVAFWSLAGNLVGGDANGAPDVFLHDRSTGETTRITVGSNGASIGGTIWGISVSGDGGIVTFASEAPDLVPGDTNGASDVFVWERSRGGVRRISLKEDGSQAMGNSYLPVVSSNGTVVAFDTSSELTASDDNLSEDVYAVDLLDGTVALASVDSDGLAHEGFSWGPSISSDGRYVAFESDATLSSADHRTTCSSGLGFTPCGDIYVRDMCDGVTTLESVNSSGIQGDLDSLLPSISR